MTERSDERARAFWVAGRGRGELRAEVLPAPAAGEVRVRALASAVSRGTEALVFHGRVPESLFAAMRCPFQAGEFPWPVKYGYCSVGAVEAGEAGLVGKRVFCLHPHQDRYVVPAAAVAIVPDGVPDARATLAANMETALNALWDAPPRLGDRIAVIGAGVVGLFVASLARRTPGARVAMIEPHAARAALARDIGLEVCPPESISDADLVFHASGHPDGLVTALSLAGMEATIVELSWYGDRPVTVPLGEAFHSRRLRLISSQVGQVAPAKRPRWSHARRLALALDLLAEPVYDRLIGERIRFADLPAAMARITAEPVTPPAVVVTYP